jgi:S-adenosylmethionine synthetase
MKTSVLLVKGFPVELRKRAKMQALKEDLSLKAIIIKAVEEYLKKVGG